MSKFDNIPKSAYDELVALMGKEKAEAFIEGEFYNYQAVVTKIATLRIRRFIKSKPFLAILALLVLILLAILYFI